MTQRKKRFVNTPQPINRNPPRTFKENTEIWLRGLNVQETTIYMTIGGVLLLVVSFASKPNLPGASSFFDVILGILGTGCLGAIGYIWKFRREMYDSRAGQVRGTLAVISGVVLMIFGWSGTIYFLFLFVQRLFRP
jgi:hypothetical protein